MPLFLWALLGSPAVQRALLTLAVVVVTEITVGGGRSPTDNNRHNKEPKR